MRALLDVNVLVALAWPNHVHHGVARRWFLANHRRGWATCPLTETGFVRVSSNRAVVADAVSPAAAVAVLREFKSVAGHEFWADDVEFGDERYCAVAQIGGSRHVTDAHLLALAIRHEGRLVSFDAGLVNLLPTTASSNSLLVIRS